MSEASAGMGDGASSGRADQGGITEKARETATQLADQVQERASGALETVREQAGNWQAMLADKLESGADAIRERLEAEDGAADGGGVIARVSGAGEAVAGSLERSALWLRENELADLGTALQRQLRERPGRTALIALGIGILIGRSSRR